MEKWAEFFRQTRIWLEYENVCEQTERRLSMTPRLVTSQENKDSNVRNTKLKASNMSTDQSQYEHLKSETTTYSCVHSSCNFCYCFSFYKLRQWVEQQQYSDETVRRYEQTCQLSSDWKEVVKNNKRCHQKKYIHAIWWAPHRKTANV